MTWITNETDPVDIYFPVAEVVKNLPANAET